MCLDRPVVLVLEDLHWADESSLAAILAILHNLAHVPLLVMATLRRHLVRPSSMCCSPNVPLQERGYCS